MSDNAASEAEHLAQMMKAQAAWTKLLETLDECMKDNALLGIGVFCVLPNSVMMTAWKTQNYEAFMKLIGGAAIIQTEMVMKNLQSTDPRPRIQLLSMSDLMRSISPSDDEEDEPRATMN